ncbi:hypothetical protein ACFYTQ_17020 [Nocardia sp. NPDC004068]|uniref:hypothetical protein n=1 Tax=Nocardia sp. NPDC004068 TaxID=3364303 RepID=UPI0036CB274B
MSVRTRVDAPDRASRRTAQPKKVTPRRAESAERVKTGAAQRAYARRRARTRGGSTPLPGRAASAMAGRLPFVAGIIALLGCGLALTLLLTTRAAEDSYQLGDARRLNRQLGDERAALQREVEAADSAPELANRARELGMIPAKDPVRLLVAPDGTVTVIGKETPAEGTPAPPLNTSPTTPTPAPKLVQAQGERVVPVQPAPGQTPPGATPPGQGQPPAPGQANGTGQAAGAPAGQGGTNATGQPAGVNGAGQAAGVNGVGQTSGAGAPVGQADANNQAPAANGGAPVQVPAGGNGGPAAESNGTGAVTNQVPVPGQEQAAGANVPLGQSGQPQAAGTSNAPTGGAIARDESPAPAAVPEDAPAGEPQGDIGGPAALEHPAASPDIRGELRTDPLAPDEADR